MNEVLAQPDAQAAFGALVRYLLATHERIDRERLRRTIERAVQPSAGEFVVTEYDRLVEQGRRKGLRQGIERGLAQGRVQGVAEVLLDLMEDKLGPVPDEVKARVQAATFAELKTWALRAHTATTLAEVFDAPDAPPPDAQQPAPGDVRQSLPRAARKSRGLRR